MTPPVDILRAEPDDLDAALDALDWIDALLDTITSNLKDKPVAAAMLFAVADYVGTGRNNMAVMIMRRSDRLRDVPWVQ